VESHRPSKDEAILTNVAESIGSTLGTIAAKAGAVQKALTKKVAAVKPRARRVVKRVVGKRTSARRKRAPASRSTAASRRAKRKS
jgi:hypothetical protein